MTADQLEPVPYEVHERQVMDLIEERDRLREVADALAARIAPAEVLGEHSNANDPWQNALDYAPSTGEHDARVLEDAATALERRADILFRASERLWRLSDYGARDRPEERKTPGADALAASARSGQMGRDAKWLHERATAMRAGLLATAPSTGTVENAARQLLDTAWESRVGGPYRHTPSHYVPDCPLCRPDLDDNAQRIVRAALAAAHPDTTTKEGR